MPRAAVYARVSTSDQHPDTQLAPLRSYCACRGFEATEYVDHGVSGAKARRPALEQLMDDARRRAVDVLVVAKLDRLARSVHDLTTLGHELAALGVDLIVVDQAIDTTTPAGRLLFNVLGSIAEFERDLIRERTRAGLAAARRRGKTLGRPRALSREQLKRLGRLASCGQSQRYIAQVLGVGRTTVARELARLRAPRR